MISTSELVTEPRDSFAFDYKILLDKSILKMLISLSGIFDEDAFRIKLADLRSTLVKEMKKEMKRLESKQLRAAVKCK